MQYTLPIAADARPQRHVTTLHIMVAFLLFAVGIVGIVLYWFTSVTPAFKGHAYTPFIVFGVLAILTSVTLLVLTVKQRAFLQQKRNSSVFRTIELVLMLAATGIFFQAGWKVPALLFAMMSVVLLYALYNERRVIPASAVSFDDAGISLPSANGLKKIDWSKAERVILKHSVLTISMADNTLIQRDLSSADAVPGTAFEQWCAQKIDASRSRRLNDAW